MPALVKRPLPGYVLAMRVVRSGRISANACCISALLSGSLSACSGGAEERTERVAEPALPGPENLSAPEAGTIVFRSDRDSDGGDLYLMASDGSAVRRLTDGGGYWTPLWSPDGASIAFRQETGLDTEIGLVASSGGDPVILVAGEDPELLDYLPAWSGDELIYGSHAGGPDADLWAVARSGGQRHVLFAARSGRRWEADVSRADARIALSWSPEATRSSGFVAGTDIWVATSGDDAVPENLTEGRVYLPSGPRWSPDGASIAFWGFVRAADGSPEGFGSHADGANPPDSELFLIDVSTHELTRLTDNAQDDQTPAWTPDGNEDIWKMPIAAPEQAVDLIDDADAPSSDVMPDCFWGLPAR
jgi:Tol biopolymer transport system component